MRYAEEDTDYAHQGYELEDTEADLPDFGDALSHRGTQETSKKKAPADVCPRAGGTAVTKDPVISAGEDMEMQPEEVGSLHEAPRLKGAV